jgi:hypothetical protein
MFASCLQHAIFQHLRTGPDVSQNNSAALLLNPHIQYMKNGVFWDVTPHGSCQNWCFRGTYRFQHQIGKNQQARNISSNFFVKYFGWLILLMLFVARRFVTLMMEVIRSSETSKVTRHTIPEDSILHSHYCENLNSYIPYMFYIQYHNN